MSCFYVLEACYACIYTSMLYPATAAAFLEHEPTLQAPSIISSSYIIESVDSISRDDPDYTYT